MIELSETAETLPRRCRVLAGSRTWALGRLDEFVTQLPGADLLWIGEQAPAGVAAVSARQVRHYLGRECALLVFDAHAGFAVDAFAAALGTLRGGGELLLLVPDWEGWAQIDAAGERLASFPLTRAHVGTRFLTRLRALFDRAGCVTLERQGVHEQPLVPATVPGGRRGWVLTGEQRAAVQAIERVANGHARRPLVITADRGRGKTTALGMALVGLLRERPREVVLLAPSRQAVSAVFEVLRRELPEGEGRGDLFDWRQGRVEFRLPDEQLYDPRPCDLLLIDEAAAIALPVLQGLLAGHNRVVFSSTVHGYEGSGRGFVLRFARVLERTSPQHRALSLSRPVRWARDDPLEALLDEALLLDAEFDSPAPGGAVEYQWLSQDALAEDEALLRNLFALLIGAHYQTRPSDLHQLLDAPGLHTLVAQRDGVIVGAALLVEEGGFERTLAQQVCLGERRPRGHMLLQSLAAHAGLCEAPTLRLLRVMRIAVADRWRNLGVGSALLQKAVAWAGEHGFDLFGSAFGVEPRLLHFWRRQQLQPVRLGHRRDPASGTHSVQMLRGLSESGEALASRGAVRFRQQFPWRLAHSFRQLPVDLVLAMLQGRDCSDLSITQQDREDVAAFAFARRGFEDAAPALWRWLCHELAGEQGSLAEDPERDLLVARVLQNRCLKTGATPPLDAGRAAQHKRLRSAVAKRLRQS